MMTIYGDKQRRTNKYLEKQSHRGFFSFIENPPSSTKYTEILSFVVVAVIVAVVAVAVMAVCCLLRGASSQALNQNYG